MTWYLCLSHPSVFNLFWCLSAYKSHCHSSMYIADIVELVLAYFWFVFLFGFVVVCLFFFLIFLAVVSETLWSISATSFSLEASVPKISSIVYPVLLLTHLTHCYNLKKFLFSIWIRCCSVADTVAACNTGSWHQFMPRLLHSDLALSYWPGNSNGR